MPLAGRHSLQATHWRQAARRYAPASLKSGSQLNVGRCADGIKSCVGRGMCSRDASLKQLPLRSPENMRSNPCSLRRATAARKCVVHGFGRHANVVGVEHELPRLKPRRGCRAAT